MRAEWNARARQDARFYAAFARRNQTDEEFIASAADTLPTLEKEFRRLPGTQRALEIGCGPGRLMVPMSRHFAEIHGVDISEEMVALASDRLKNIPHAHVRVGSGSDLADFPDDFCDFVYSYTVFQHIPSRDVVLNYLRESRRVLRSGGILCCQLRGTPPLDTEMQRETETWTGCYFYAGEMFAFAEDHDFQLVAISGIDTQYMWTTWRKPGPPLNEEFSRLVLKDVTISSGSEHRVPNRGQDACVSLWIEGLPSHCHLGNLEVWFGEMRTQGCYLSPITETGGCQLNARVPPSIAPGTVLVGIKVLHSFRFSAPPEESDIVEGCTGETACATLGLRRGSVVEQAVPPARCPIEVYDLELTPSVVTITDAIEIGSKFRIETGGLKVTLEGIAEPHEVSFHLRGRIAEIVQVECKDPILSKYEYSFYLPHRTPKGPLDISIRVSGRDLPPARVEVV